MTDTWQRSSKQSIALYKSYVEVCNNPLHNAMVKSIYKDKALVLGTHLLKLGYDIKLIGA